MDTLNPRKCWWNWPGRGAVFALASSSIACLLAEFYEIGSMQFCARWIFLPAAILLAALAAVDWLRNDGRLARALLIGSGAGIAAAVAYDLFRVPFVWSREWHIDSVVPPLPLFKVFPHFGALLLGEDPRHGSFSPAAHALGWAYHFSNGAAFGIMYVSLLDRPAQRHWAWAVFFAVGLEVAMLCTPYRAFFGITTTAAFVVTTLVAHLVFGIVLGMIVKRQGARDAVRASLPAVRPGDR